MNLTRREMLSRETVWRALRALAGLSVEESRSSGLSPEQAGRALANRRRRLRLPRRRREGGPDSQARR